MSTVARCTDTIKSYIEMNKYINIRFFIQIMKHNIIRVTKSPEKPNYTPLHKKVKFYILIFVSIFFILYKWGIWSNGRRKFAASIGKT
jgi:hypothetical protein